MLTMQVYKKMVEERLSEFKTEDGREFVWFYETKDSAVLSEYVDRKHRPTLLLKPRALVYISGQISGLDRSDAEKQFSDAQLELENEGYYVFNPMVVGAVITTDRWEDYMIEDLKYLMKVDIIYVLPNWRASRGARIEIFLAMQLGKKVFNRDGSVFEWYPQLLFVDSKQTTGK